MAVITRKIFCDKYLLLISKIPLIYEVKRPHATNLDYFKTTIIIFTLEEPTNQHTTICV